MTQLSQSKLKAVLAVIDQDIQDVADQDIIELMSTIIYQCQLRRMDAKTRISQGGWE